MDMKSRGEVGESMYFCLSLEMETGRWIVGSVEEK